MKKTKNLVSPVFWVARCTESQVDHQLKHFPLECWNLWSTYVSFITTVVATSQTDTKTKENNKEHTERHKANTTWMSDAQNLPNNSLIFLFCSHSLLFLSCSQFDKARLLCGLNIEIHRPKQNFKKRNQTSGFSETTEWKNMKAIKTKVERNNEAQPPQRRKTKRPNQESKDQWQNCKQERTSTRKETKCKKKTTTWYVKKPLCSSVFCLASARQKNLENNFSRRVPKYHLHEKMLSIQRTGNPKNTIFPVFLVERIPRVNKRPSGGIFGLSLTRSIFLEPPFWGSSFGRYMTSIAITLQKSWFRHFWGSSKMNENMQIWRDNKRPGEEFISGPEKPWLFWGVRWASY